MSKNNESNQEPTKRKSDNLQNNSGDSENDLNVNKLARKNGWTKEETKHMKTLLTSNENRKFKPYPSPPKKSANKPEEMEVTPTTSTSTPPTIEFLLKKTETQGKIIEELRKALQAIKQSSTSSRHVEKTDWTTENPFSTLNEEKNTDAEDQPLPSSEDDADNEDFTEVQKKKKKKNKKRSAKEQNTPEKDATPTSRTISKKPPPISIQTTNTKDIVEWLKPSLNSENFFFKSRNKEYKTLYTNDKYTYTEALKILNEKQAKHFTYTPKEDKIISRLLKGLYDDFEESEIEKEIAELKLDNVKILKIKKINTKDFFKSTRGGVAFLVQVSGDSNISNLTKHTRIAHHVVRWEKINNRNGLQCMNCQRWGHIASKCNMGYRCVKCSSHHGPKECTISLNKETVTHKDLFCVNCNKNGHPASYKGCPYLKEARKKMLEKVNIRKQNTIDKINRYSNPNLTYSRALNSHSQANVTFSQLSPDTDVSQKSSTPTEHIKSTILEQIRAELHTTIKTELSSLLEAVRKNTECINTLFSFYMNPDDNE